MLPKEASVIQVYQVPACELILFILLQVCLLPLSPLPPLGLVQTQRNIMQLK